MALYNTLFFYLYLLFKWNAVSLEARESWAFGSAVFVSLLPTLNIISVVGLTDSGFFVAYLISMSLTLFYFLPERYKVIVRVYSTKRPSKYLVWAGILYAIGSIIVFEYRR
jgi:hypothetical protein